MGGEHSTASYVQQRLSLLVLFLSMALFLVMWIGSLLIMEGRFAVHEVLISGNCSQNMGRYITLVRIFQ